MTAEDRARRAEKRRKEKERWKTILAYYMMQKYAEEKAKLNADISAGHNPTLAAFIVTSSVIDKLFKRRPGSLSAFEMLLALEGFEEPDSPFMDLLTSLREQPRDAEKIDRSIVRCVTEEPVRIVQRVDMEQEARQSGIFSPENEKSRSLRLKYEIEVLRALMPPELFRELCSVLETRGIHVDPERETELDKQPVPQRQSDVRRQPEAPEKKAPEIEEKML